MKLLSLQAYSENGAADLILPSLIGLVLFFIAIFITRAVFSIPTILKYYKMQTVLLIKIARSNGVDEKEINKIISVIQAGEGEEFTNDVSIRKLDSKD